MDNVELLRTFGRMCGETSCGECKLHNVSRNCIKFFMAEPENAAEIIEAWAAEHLIKTRAMDFFEKFPNAPKNDDGTPCVCAKLTGHMPESETCRPSMRLSCWNAPLEVEE